MIYYAILILMFFVLALHSCNREVCYYSLNDKTTTKNFTKKGEEPLWYIIPYFILFLIFAFRGISVGTDTSHYYSAFMDNEFSKFELLYRAICALVYYTSKNFLFVNAICGAILIFTLYLAFDNLFENKHLVFFAFVGLTYFAQTMNITRQYLAFSFIFLAFTYLTRKKYFLTILFYIIAILFHKTSIVCVIIFVGYFLPINKKSVIIFLTSIVAIVVALPYLTKLLDTLTNGYYYDAYMNSAGGFSINYFLELLLFICVAVFLVSYKKYAFRLLNKTEKKLYNFCFVDCLILIFTEITTMIYSTYIQRVSLYFILPLVLISPILFKCINKRYRDIVLCAFLVGFLVLNIIELQVKGIYEVVPYVLWF